MSSKQDSENPTADCQNRISVEANLGQNTENENLNEESENSNTYILNENCVEVKLEIELNEGEAENITCNKPLHFLNVNHQPPPEISTEPYVNIGYCSWNPNSVSLSNNENASYLCENKQHYISQFNNAACDVLSGPYPNEKLAGGEPHNASKSSTCGFHLDNSVGETSSSSQHSETYIITKKRRWKPTDAEKKRNYRSRIKEENPELWSAIKLKERCRKKEQREEKRLVLFEMQKTQALITECESTEVEAHKAHLQALRERYPDVWIQFAHDMSPIKNLSSTQDWESQKRQWPSLTEAEKKRYYRRKMKEENPEMWTAIKMKDAYKKREQREEKRHILLEMQKAKELISHPDSSNLEEHRSHLERLKEKYPDLWIQLEDAIAATKVRAQMVMLNKSNKKGRRMTKPVEMYKDVVEAHKKFLYRQKLKEERPEYYAQMKARDAYAKSIRRMMIKRGICANNSRFDLTSIASTGQEFGLTVETNAYVINSESDRYYTRNKSDEYNISTGGDGYYANIKRSEYYTTSKSEYNITAEKDVYNINADNNSLTISG